MAPPVETPGSTQVVNDGVSRVAVRTDVGRIPSSLLAATQTGFADDIHSFLAKPILLTSGTVTTAQVAGDIISTELVPNDLLNTSIYQQKVRGFLGFRATTVIKIQMNSNKFQAGRLIGVFVPQAGIADTYPGMRLRSLTAITQLPRIEADISMDTEVTMEIPYVSPSPYFNLTSGSNPVGKFYLMIYSPLNLGIGGSDHVDFTVWGSFKDVELVTPTFRPEMGRPGKGSVANESDSVNSKSLSSVLAAGSAVARVFTGVPMLSNLMGPSNWFLSATAKAAAAFGYSKPSSESPMTKFIQVGQYNMANADGIEVAPKLGVASDNSVGILPGYGGSDLDEMTISHLVQIPAFWTNVQWSDSAAAGTSLLTMNLEPSTFAVYGSSVGTTVTRPYADDTPVAYPARLFTYWRGSFTFTLKIVKTSFHSGRLLFWFNPAPTIIIPTLAETEYCYRQIIDVREKSEFTFTVPFASTKQYHLTQSVFATPTELDSYGTAGIYVLNDLVHPPTVSSDVQILIEVSGAPDFEYAVPRRIAFAPLIEQTWESQMGDVIGPTASGTIDCTQCDVAVGGATVVPSTLDPSYYCMGERVLSLLQLMKKYSYCRYYNDLFSGGESTVHTIKPYVLYYIRSSEPATPVDFAGPFLDPYSVVGPMYAYSRGSMRMAFTPFTGTNVIANDSPWNAYAHVTNNNATYNISTGVPVYSGNLLIHTFPGSTRSTKFVSLPSYADNYCRLNRPNTGNLTTQVDEFSCDVALQVNQIPATSNRIIWMRAVGEDFNLAYFLGTPRVVALSF